MKNERRSFEFYAIEMKTEGRVFQAWYDGLSFDAQEEIVNLIMHLRKFPTGLWGRPDYDPLEGDCGISELRPLDIRSEDGVKTIRLYGRLGYPDKNAYTFLHGTEKDEKNDHEGKRIARSRFAQLGGSSVHKFYP